MNDVDDALRTLTAMAEVCEDEGQSGKAVSCLVRKAELLRDSKLDLDGAEEALAALPDELVANEWVKGILLVDRKLRAALESEGVVEVPAFAPLAWTADADLGVVGARVARVNS